MVTPCIAQCRLIDDVCVGCSRTKEQIKAWSHLTDDERLAIMRQLGYGMKRKIRNVEQLRY